MAAGPALAQSEAPAEPLRVTASAQPHSDLSVRAEVGTQLRDYVSFLEQLPGDSARHRNDALLNGALIAMGAVGILDNVIAHWILELHRAVPGEHALAVEIGIVIVSAAMLGYGLYREIQARRALRALR